MRSSRLFVQAVLMLVALCATQVFSKTFNARKTPESLRDTRLRSLPRFGS